MIPFALIRPVCLGMLLAASLEVGSSAVWRLDPYGLVRLGLLPGDGGPVIAAKLKPGGDVGRAVAAFDAGDHEAAAAHFVRAVLIDPDDVEARRALGAIQLGLQDFEAALGQLRAADRLHPGDAETLYQLAWALHSTGQPEEAMFAAWRAMRRQPGWAPGLIRLGLVRIGAGDTENGEANLRRGADGHDVPAEALFEVGSYFLDMDRPLEAIPYLRRALAERPDYSWAANNLGNAYRAAGLPEDARESYQLAITADAENPNPHNGLGVLREAKGDLAGALASYRSAARVDDTYMDARYNAGVVLLKLGRPTEALSELEAAQLLRPDHASTYYQLGEACFRLGQVARAKTLHRKATSLDPALRKLGGEVSKLLGERGE